MDLFVPIEVSYLLNCTVVGNMEIRQTLYLAYQEVRAIHFCFLLIRIIKQKSQTVETNFVQV